jgi:hypothetical protein
MSGALLHTVKSRAIAKLGYDAASETLYVVFRRGEVWAYHGVPR